MISWDTYILHYTRNILFTEAGLQTLYWVVSLHTNFYDYTVLLSFRNIESLFCKKQKSTFFLQMKMQPNDHWNRLYCKCEILSDSVMKATKPCSKYIESFEYSHSAIHLNDNRSCDHMTFLEVKDLHFVSRKLKDPFSKLTMDVMKTKKSCSLNRSKLLSHCSAWLSMLLNMW